MARYRLGVGTPALKNRLISVLGGYVEVAGQQPHVSETRRAGKDGLEKVPAVIWHTRQVDCKLSQDAALTGIAGIRHQRASKLPPASSLSNIDEAFDTTLPEREHGMRCSDLELAEKCDGWDTREFANERGDSPSALARTADGDEYGLYLLRLEIADQIIDALTMQCPIASFASGIDT